MKELIHWHDFEKIDIRIGTIIKASVFEKAKKPAYKLIIDFGPLGIRKTSAQITKLYQPQNLIGQQVSAIVNFPPKQIANIMSKCLILGGVEPHNKVTLLVPHTPVPNGTPVS